MGDPGALLRSGGLAAGLAGGLAALVGCSGGQPADRSAVADDPAGTAVAAATPTPTASTATPRPPAGPPPTPATTAGPLTRQDLPAPDDLGGEWTPWVDPGDIADGYAGNGTDVRERDAREVTDALAPLGCAGLTGPPDLPLPDYALEATFRAADGRAAVALVLDYPDAATAGAALTSLGDALRQCPPAAPGEKPGPFRLVVDVRAADDELLVDERREQGPQAAPGRWLEVGVRVGDRLGLTALQVGATAPDADRLAAALRRVTGG